MVMVIRLQDVLAHLGLCHRHGDKGVGCFGMHLFPVRNAVFFVEMPVI